MVTAHRRESFGPPLLNIFKAIKKIALKYPEEVCFVYPVHLNPVARATAHVALKGFKNVFLIEALEYLSFVNVMKKSCFIMTDSGGIQEEAATLGKPILMIRETTERPEIVEAGAAEIVGTDPIKIIGKPTEILHNVQKYNAMSHVKNPYGDGKASLRIVSRLLNESRSIGLHSERKNRAKRWLVKSLSL